MAFRSTAEIQSFLMSKMQSAVIAAGNKAHDIINQFLQKYYSEFAPDVYIRTSQLLHSLVQSNIIATGNGYQIEVYFDAGRMHYTTGTWSSEKVLDTAMHGSHGGYVAGTAIWDESEAVLNATMLEILKQQLIAAGIPIR